jgi:hypothetical protein
MVSPGGKIGTVPFEQIGRARAAGATLFSGGSSSVNPQRQTNPLQSLYSASQTAQNNYDSNTQTVPGTSASGVIQNVGSGVADVTAGALVHPLATVVGMAKSVASPYSALPDIVNGLSDAYAKGGLSGAGERLLGNVAGSIATGKAIGAALPEAPVTGQNYTPSQAAAFEGLQANATGMGKNFFPQQITPQALSPLRETAARMAAGSPQEQGIIDTATSGHGMNSLGAVQNIVQRSLNDLESQHSPVLAQYQNSPVDVSSLRQSVQSHLSPSLDPADTSGLNTLLDRIDNVRTVGDLNKFRSQLNQETSPSYRQSGTAMARGPETSQAANELAGNVRGLYYDNLKQLSGQDFRPLKAQESNLLTLKEALENQASPLSVNEARFNAPNTLRGTIGEFGEVLSNPKKAITQTLLRENPGARTGMLIKKALSGLPEPKPFAQQTFPSSPFQNGAQSMVNPNQLPNGQLALPAPTQGSLNP